MRHRASASGRTLLAVFALTFVCACAGESGADKTPLDAMGSTTGAEATASDLPAAAQAALAAGNDAYRSGNYTEALAEYNKAVAAAPTNAAPYYGVLMAAQKMGNSALADSASAMIRKLSGEDAAVHTGAAPPNPHPQRPPQ